MRVTKVLHFKQRTFNVGALSAAMVRISRRVLGEFSVHVTVYRTLGDGTEGSQASDDFSILSTICDIGNDENFTFTLTKGKKDYIGHGEITVSVSGSDKRLSIRCSAESSELLFQFGEAFKSELGLDVADEEEVSESREEKLEKAVEALRVTFWDG